MGSPSSISDHHQNPLTEEAGSIISNCNSSATMINSLYFEVHTSSDFGRYLVAKEDIDERTLILSEAPLLYGPTDDKDLKTDTVFLYCLSCCRQLKKTLKQQQCDENYIDHLPSRSQPSANGNGVAEEEQQQQNVNSLALAHREENDDGCTSGIIGNLPDNVYLCSKCGWPVCDKYCEVAPVHSENECKFFNFLHYNHSTFPPPHQWLMYKSVILLRLLLLIHKNPEEVFHDFLEKLEHHTETRESKPSYVKADKIVLENLKYFTEGLKSRVKKGNSKSKKKFYNLRFLEDEKMLIRLIGTLNVNAFCANNDASKRIARCMFTKASLFAHSCKPNCAWTIEMSLADPQKKLSSSSKRRRRKNGCCGESLPQNRVSPQIQVYSAVPIKKGELVTIPYSTRNIFYGTLKRQLCMETVGHFMCKCRRCMDPSEEGSYMSAIRCFRCEKGFLITSDAANEEAHWICVNLDDDGDDDDVCDYKCSVGKIVYFTTIIQDQIDWIDSQDLHWDLEQEKLQKIYDKYCGGDLHKNHYLLHEISEKITELLAERLSVAENEFLEEERLSKEKREMLLERFLYHVKNLIRIGDMILPGFNSHQNQLKYYLDLAESLQNAN